ncbi:acyl-CoA dehydrogenase family protein [Enterovirga sp. CN4-39]|uniref:acyl-CoA dehydrogenase family protein n=1 Tax=Enterovirga sp. CN4-39 TaxID=3400910 RepID=UPI003C062FBB
MTWQLPVLPFFDEPHRRLAERIASWCDANAALLDQHPDADGMEATCRAILSSLSEAGFGEYVVPHVVEGRVQRPDVRSICILREAITYRSFLADTMFVMQGLGTAALWNWQDTDARDRYLDGARRGTHVAALALTEPETGSDVAAITTRAVRDGDDYVIDGAKAWISSAGIADHYVVVARTGEGPGAKGLSAFILDADTPGLRAGPPVEMIAPHPIGPVAFEGCRVPGSRRIGPAGEGFKAAMATFDIFRPTVGGAAVGAARRALDETIARVTTRRLFGKTMAEMESVQAKIADMTADTETAALMVYRAAWTADVVGGRVSRESALAKLVATEAAGRVIDSAVQLFGALGVSQGCVIEQLYRDVRPMRIYEGASEVQKVVIARSMLRARA